MSAVYEGIKNFGVVTVENDHRNSLLGDELCSLQFRNHSTRSAVGTRTACRIVNFIDVFYTGNEIGIGICAGIGVEKSVDVRKIQKKVCLGEQSNVR